MNSFEPRPCGRAYIVMEQVVSTLLKYNGLVFLVLVLNPTLSSKHTRS